MQEKRVICQAMIDVDSDMAQVETAAPRNLATSSNMRCNNQLS